MGPWVTKHCIMSYGLGRPHKLCGGTAGTCGWGGAGLGRQDGQHTVLEVEFMRVWNHRVIVLVGLSE